MVRHLMEIVGPIFNQTVDSTVYQQIVTDLIANLENEDRYIWFQLDGALRKSKNHQSFA